MLNYNLKPGQIDDTLIQEEYEGVIAFNPFPGLRPFSIEESHLFFGREDQVDEILIKLSKHRFISILGQSGSGKSSLINCGLVPVLYGGFMTDSGPHWQIIQSRPGQSPYDNLTQSIVKFLIKEGRISQEESGTHKLIINSILKSGSHGLIELCKYLRAQHHENIFFLFDQFEEIFRLRENAPEHSDEVTSFVNLIITSLKNRSLPIYIAIAMRSDFIGECASFPGLTNLINLSNYLIPQMTRDQKRIAIEGPIAVGGGKISQRLVKRLLTDIGDSQDQLPILQHSLMRTWDYWVENHELGEPLDIRHYNAIGKIHQALSLHANEAYEELNQREKEIAEILFKTITEKNQQNQWLRRAERLRTIAQIADCSEQDLINVIERFRQSGRSFLMPSAAVNLSSNSLIEISHESLMRIWTRLKSWVEEEYESAQMYKRISEAAALYQNGRTSLWRLFDLQLGLNWQVKQKPTRSWAERYDVSFERAIVFLETSQITYEAELKNQELAQQRMLRRARVTSIVLGIAALIVSVFFLYALNQSIQAESARQAEAEQRQAAEDNARAAELARADAEAARSDAEQRSLELSAANQELQAQRENLRLANEDLAEALREAENQRNIALAQTAIANEQRKKADSALDVALSAVKEREKQYMLSVAKTMAVQSLRIEENQLMGNLAMMSYIINKEYGGKAVDPEVYFALYNAQSKIQGAKYNTITAHRNAVRTIALTNNSTRFFSSGSDARIMEGDYSGKQIEKLVDRRNSPVRVLAVSEDDKYLAAATDSASIQVYEITDVSSRPIILTGHAGRVNHLKFINEALYSSSSDKTVRISYPATGQSRTLATTAYEIKNFDIDKRNNKLIGGTAAGSLISIDLNTREISILPLDAQASPIHSVSVHPSGKTVAIGNERGSIKIFDMDNKVILHELSGHKSGVTTVAFSPDGNMLASSAKDGRMQIWQTNAYNELPVVIEDNFKNRNTAYIWDMKFTKDGKFLITGSEDGAVRVWPTNTEYFAQTLCDQLIRNMTKEEWENYAGNEVNYRSTCLSLLVEDF